MSRTSSEPLVIGWRETISLPELGAHSIAAKIDTGARTTAMHATNIEPFTRDGLDMVRFDAHDFGQDDNLTQEFAIEDEREVRNTGGVPERRYVIRTPVVINKRRWPIEITLTDRAEMAHPIIVGRTAIRGHAILVNPNRSFLLGRPRPSTAVPKGDVS